MTQRRTTHYICDSCGKQSTVKKDLRRLSRHLLVVVGDLCDECEQNLIEAAAGALPELADAVRALRRAES